MLRNGVRKNPPGGDTRSAWTLSDINNNLEMSASVKHPLHASIPRAMPMVAISHSLRTEIYE